MIRACGIVKPTQKNTHHWYEINMRVFILKGSSQSACSPISSRPPAYSQINQQMPRCSLLKGNGGKDRAGKYSFQQNTLWNVALHFIPIYSNSTKIPSLILSRVNQYVIIIVILWRLINTEDFFFFFFFFFFFVAAETTWTVSKALIKKPKYTKEWNDVKWWETRILFIFWTSRWNSNIVGW